MMVIGYVWRLRCGITSELRVVVDIKSRILVKTNRLFFVVQ